MVEQTPPDPEQMLASIMDQQKQVFTAGRKATLDGLQAYEQTLSAFADSQEKLADSTDVDWLSRLLRAQAGFTREVVDALGKFTREVTDDT